MRTSFARDVSLHLIDHASFRPSFNNRLGMHWSPTTLPNARHLPSGHLPLPPKNNHRGYPPVTNLNLTLNPNSYTDFVLSNLILGWLGSRLASVLDSGAERPRFKSQPRRCRVTVSGKLFTPLCLCSPSSKIGSSPLKGCEGNCRPGGK